MTSTGQPPPDLPPPPEESVRWLEVAFFAVALVLALVRVVYGVVRREPDGPDLDLAYLSVPVLTVLVWKDVRALRAQRPPEPMVPPPSTPYRTPPG